MNQKVSSHLFIDVATDEEGNPILEAEYAGYDDGGTPEDESDDNHLYYIRHYKLREVPVPLDNDGDLFENEDPVDGVDNDGDGAVDEDPEDSQPLRGASTFRAFADGLQGFFGVLVVFIILQSEEDTIARCIFVFESLLTERWEFFRAFCFHHQSP